MNLVRLLKTYSNKFISFPGDAPNVVKYVLDLEKDNMILSKPSKLNLNNNRYTK